ncbi:hypothetical protein MTX78_19805 [Hymenobacter tibetensis]|uniref:Rho termination factor N-terminal domain-containing protein n=1 Tax=Hymenobacter tibetensis TaxID=497967 RepID=A0ABY4CVQ7_9BACT|nr:hypothetical protein [Hymenobacter tibetensis]UOG74350.1 hypothetical protein MTX78_19805 [Hymenobacter tibetensis]
MPRPSLSKIYSAGARQAELIELCKQRGLPIQNSKGGKLTNEALKRQLDDFSADQGNISALPAAEEASHVSGSANRTEEILKADDDTSARSVDTKLVDSTSEAVEAEPQAVKWEQGSSMSLQPELFPIFSPPAAPHSSAVTPELIITNPDNLEETSFERDTAGILLPSEQVAVAQFTKVQDHSINKVDATHGASSRLTFTEEVKSSPRSRPDGPYYLQLSHSKLATSLSRGVFIPVALDPDPELQRMRSGDLLSKYPNCLPLLHGRLASFSDQDVLVELTLRPSEVNQLVEYGSIYAYLEPLPVSRIQSLTFANADALADIQADALTYKNFFLPQQRIMLLSEGKIVPLIELPPDTEVHISEAPNADNWIPRLQQFDQQLGLFGYLKHAPLLAANTTQTVQDYSAEFQYALSLLNTTVATPPPASGSELLLRTLLRINPSFPQTAGQMLLSALVDSIYAGTEASLEWATQLLANVIAQSSSIVGKHSGLQDLEETQRQIDLLKTSRTNYQDALAAIARGGRQSIPKVPFAAVVLLIKHPNRARSSADKQAVLDVLGKAADRGALASPQLEWLLAILGLYYTYSRLTREDPNLHIRNPNLAALARPLHRLRFDMDHFADRVVVETVFRVASEGKVISDRLAYLGPDDEQATTIELPLRATGFSSAQTLFDAPTKPVVNSTTVTASMPSNDLILHQSVLRKMLALFAPEQFEQLLLPSFTPAEQTLLRQVLAFKQ